MELVINLLVTFAVLTIAFFYFKSQITKSLNSQTLLQEVRKEVEVLVRGLNETAARNIDLLEDQVKKLDDLLKTADKKILQLSKESQRRETASQTYEHLARSKVSAPPAKNNTLPLFGSEEPPAEAPPVKKTRREQVLDLHSQGFSADLIAARLGLPQAEVELIISLAGGRR